MPPSIPWPVKQQHHAHMRKRQLQNQVSCRQSNAEAWMWAKLKTTGLKWRRQAQSGFRLFDFWNHRLGLAIEVDGPEHDSAQDAVHDATVYQQRGIVVLRVRNFHEGDARDALQAIIFADSWNERRRLLKLAPIQGAE